MKKINYELLKSNIKKIAEYELLGNHVFGIGYAVSVNGKAVFEEYYGTDGKGRTLNGNSIFRLASMTKPITATAILTLADRGLLTIDTEAEKILPELKGIKIIDKNGKDLGSPDSPITIMQLLTHSAGFGISDSSDEARFTEKELKSSMGLVKYYTEKGLLFPPFSAQSYSGIGAFDVLSCIVERLTGVDYDEYVQREILAPCGMTDAGFIPTDDQWNRMVAMHQWVDGVGKEFTMRDGCVFERFPCTHLLGGAGMFSTLPDYMKFSEMLLFYGAYNGNIILSENAVGLMRTPFVPKEIMSGNERWGLGVRVITEEAYKTLPVGTFGWSGAYGSHFWVDPVNKITAVLMKNSKHRGGSGNESAVFFERAVFEAME